MAKVQIIDINGKKIKDLNSDIFNYEIREDIVQKIVEIQKERQPYAPFWLAGNQTSASGNVKHNRHVWKSDRGKGLSRYPKKRMSDKGDRFVWVAAVAPGVRGGRRAHPPKILRKKLRINKKEFLLALKSILAMAASLDMVKEKYSRLSEKELKINLPLIVENKILSLKSKEFFASLKSILGQDLWEIAIQNRKVRAGLGKMRNRKYKKSSGLLLVIGNKQDKKINGVDIKKVREVKLADFASNGARLVIFTEDAIKDFEIKLNIKKK